MGQARRELAALRRSGKDLGNRSMRSWLRWRWWLLLLALPLLAALGFVGWVSAVNAPMPEAIAALRSDGQVVVQTEPWLIFRPASGAATTGLIVYPGAKVDPRAYAPAAHAIAARGYLVAIVPMPLNLAIFGSDRAGSVIAAFPEVRHWAVGGHSLGGAMAARFAYRHPRAVQGLVLWAAYPASSDNLSISGLQVASIYGTRDGLATVAKIEASRPLLPAATQWVAIEGGNHAQFGWYGAQPGDNPAAIDRNAQQGQIVAATAALLQSLR
jgi:dienelactone hydrolase